MLLSLAIVLLGGVSFGLLPVSPLPQMDFPVIVVQASLPGASPEVMASTVATPLERSFGVIPGVNTMSLYDLASTILSQSLSQVPGVGEVQIGGSSLPAVRIELEPQALNQYGVALDDVRTTIANANVRRPKGSLEDGQRNWQIQANDQLEKAKDYEPLIIHYQNGAALRLGDVAKIKDSVEDRYNSGFFNNDSAVLLVINRQAGANIIETVNEIKAQLPALQAVLPSSVKLNLAMDRSPVIKATLHEAEMTLLIAVALVVLVVYLFLGNFRASLIPTLAVPVSLIGTFSIMYLYGFSLNNLSLMALILATGLVVDDAIVVLENISRHIDPPMKAAYLGAKEVGFTLLSMNVSLVAVFLSILFMGGIIESLFREFSITLAASIIVSLVVSLTLTPMLCARWLKPHANGVQTRLQRWSERVNERMVSVYADSLDWVLRHRRLTLLAIKERNISAQKVIERMRDEMPKVPGARLMLMADQDLQFGGGREQTTSQGPARVVPQNSRGVQGVARVDRHRRP